MKLPAALHDELSARFGEAPAEVRPVGASMSAAARLKLAGAVYVVKWIASAHEAPQGWPSVMQAEAQGLALLAQANAVRVPAVHTFAEAEAGRPAFLVMEWLQQSARGDGDTAGAALGEQLAAQHQVTAHAFGLEQHNYCGATPQQNGWDDSWIAFYGQRRLGYQLELASQRGLMLADRRRRLQRLIERLDQWLFEPEQPALLHGDLWGGNWLVTDGGTPAIIDPAAYFGHREAELAMCRLFGGFPPSFYQAYDAAWPPEPERDDRLPLYQLYHLLNHLNLFGEGYGGQVDAVLRRYAG